MNFLRLVIPASKISTRRESFVRLPLAHSFQLALAYKSMIKQLRILAMLVVMACGAVSAGNAMAQTATGTISGHVTVEDKPTSGVTVVLAPCANGRTQSDAPTKTATTDKEGYYQLSGVPAGHYCVNAFAPVWVLQPKPGYLGVDLNIAAGETVENIDMALQKGGVITGRVSDSDGQPMIGDPVNVIAVSDKGGQSFSKSELTDDRGIYRIYGLPPGNYHVSVGAYDENGGTARGGLRTHRTTYYADEPGEIDAAKAKAVSVSIDDESTDIDISVRVVSTYSVSGIVINDQTGQAVPNIRIECLATFPDGRESRTVTSNQYTSDRTGAFLLPNLTIGRYTVRTGPTEGMDLYSEPVSVTIEDSNVTGLVVKTKTSGSISGIVALNNAGLIGNSYDAPLLSSKNLYSNYRSVEGKSFTPITTQIGSDGAFHIGAIPPGIILFSPILVGSTPQLKVIRIERNGTEIRGPITINAGEAISDVRIVVGSGTGIIHGIVKIEGLSLATGTQFTLLVRPPGGLHIVTSSEIDARGQFTIKDLIAGQYGLEVQVNSVQPQPPGGPSIKIDTTDAKRTVDITDGGEVSVTLSVKLTAPPPKDGGQ